MTRRTTRRDRNRHPLWSGRVAEAQRSAPAAANVQWDLARREISRIALRRERDQQWTHLAVRITEYNERFTGDGDAPAAGRRMSALERRFKGATNPADRAAYTYDIARFHLRRITDGDDQDRQWIDLATVLAEFNERFSSTTPTVRP